MSEFNQFFSLNKNKRFAICTHAKADVDSLASAYALSQVFPNSIVCTSEDMNLGAKLLSERIGIRSKPIEEMRPSDFDGLIVVDTSSYTLLPDAKRWDIKLMIDHHRAEGRDMKAETMILDENSPSNCEIIANLLPNESITKEMAFAICVGIIADGARFKSARRETFETLARMMKICEARYDELIHYAEPPNENETKLEMLKTLEKMEHIICGPYIVITSIGETKEGDTASLLSEIGDVAFIASWKRDRKETRVSARGNKTLKVKLNEVMKEVGTYFEGDGGGHYKAAGASCKAKPKEVLKKCIDVFISKL
ncbi:MAG: DHH family phosphoesterase [Candidatus Micrarchaeota archaeon]